VVRSSVTIRGIVLLPELDEILGANYRHHPLAAYATAFLLDAHQLCN
jgi:hypothetical protein